MSHKSRCFAQCLIRQLSSSSLPKENLKPFSEVPGLSKWPLLKLISKLDARQGLENSTYFWNTFGDMVRLEIPFRPPILLLYDPEDCEKVYRAAGSQPIRPGFDALRYKFNQNKPSGS